MKPDLGCHCANLRRATRAVTTHYAAHLAPVGLTPPQFTLLGVLKILGEATPKQMAEILGMDATTLTRNLALLKAAGWTEPVVTEDRRERCLRLTASGYSRQKEAQPHWERAQRALTARLSAEEQAALSRLLIRLAEELEEEV